MAVGAEPITIGALAAATGVAAGTLRMWEARYGFPCPTRLELGHRRYQPDDVERIARVLDGRARGLSLPAAIEQARRWSPSSVPSLYVAARRQQPALEARRFSLTAMLALTRAIEDECLARASRPILAASFEQEGFYRRAEHRWRELSRTAALAFVLADFPRRRSPRAAPLEVPIPSESPLGREWAIVCLDQDFTAGLVGWEQPADDEERHFEAIWTTDPDAVTTILRVALTLARPGAPELAAHTDDIDRAAASVTADLGVTLALTNRMIAYLLAD